MKNIALIFAGGTGQRMKKCNLPKQFIEIQNKPIIIHTLEYFQKNKKIDEICVVCIKDYIDYCYELIKKYDINKVSSVIPGGKTGQESIYNGLVKINETNDGDSIILIHDGVRPLINNRIIDDAIKYAKKYGSAIPCIPCTETIVINKTDNKIVDVPPRNETFIAQAPQAFKLEEILYAHNTIRKTNPNYEQVIDSCTLYYLLGKDIYTYDGLEENIKITTRKDLFMLKSLLEYKSTKDEVNI